MPGWWFMDDARNQWPVDGANWLHGQVWGNWRLREQFVQQGNNQDPWNQHWVKQWMKAVGQFKEKLLVLMHITSSQAARASELLSIQYQNTVNGSQWNIFIKDGMMVFMTDYHKRYHQNKMMKTIHQYLPREVGELLLYYLWLVLLLQYQFKVRVMQARKLQLFIFSS
jgi:hypothetical protein